MANHSKNTDAAPAPNFGDLFEIVSCLGEGGMGTVYKVRQTENNKIYAIKVLRPELAVDEQAAKRFELEVKTASMLTHPNLVAVHQSGRTHDNAPYMVIDFIEGESLAALLKRQPKLPAPRAIKIMFQVCDGLKYAHSKGVVHRNLKPTNILLRQTEDGDDDVKLVDFGIAKIIPSIKQQTHNLTQNGEIFGSPFYMSPEQCSGHSLDSRSDIYSIGCVIFECLTGSPPFSGDSVIQTILKHVQDEPPSLSARTEVSEDLNQLVMHCLNKDPRARYQTIDDLITDLYSVVLNKPLAPLADRNQKRAIQNLLGRSALAILTLTILVSTAMVAYLLLPKTTDQTKPESGSKSPGPLASTAPLTPTFIAPPELADGQIGPRSKLTTFSTDPNDMKSENDQKRLHSRGSSEDSPLLEIYFYKGLEKMSMNHFKEAIPDFSTAIDSYNKPSERAKYKSMQVADYALACTCGSRSYCYLMLNNYDAAIADLSTAIRYEPDHQEFYLNRGKAYRLIGKNELSKKDFDMAAKLKPNSRPKFLRDYMLAP